MKNTSKNQILASEKTTIPKQQRTLMDLNLMDAFLFDVITEDTENAKKIAKVIIERTTGHIVDNLIVESQKQLKGISIDKRGIRMDIYVTEQDKAEHNKSTLRVYDIEPNNYIEEHLPYRSRFYQSLIDSKLLSTSSPFENMPEVITIWILPYDPFGENRMLYTVKNMVVENNNLVYNDGITKLFLFTKGQIGGSKELKNLLTYMEHTTPDNAVDKDLLELQEMIGSIKNRKEVGERYMTLQEMINYEKRDSFRDGLEQGISQGICGFIRFCLSLHLSKEDAKKAILEQFDLTDAQAQNYLDLYWSENPTPNP